jgi:TPR repeat protein
VFTTTAFDVYTPGTKVGPPLPIGTRVSYPTLSLLEQSAAIRSTDIMLPNALPELVDVETLFPSRSGARSQELPPQEPDRPDVLVLDDFEAAPAKRGYLAITQETSEELAGELYGQAPFDPVDPNHPGYELAGPPLYFGPPPVAVPEPGTGVLVALGLLSLSLRQRHRRAARAHGRIGPLRRAPLHLALGVLLSFSSGCAHVGKHLEIDRRSEGNRSAEQVERCREEAEAGFALAQYNLALSYFYGDGIEEDKATGAEWYRKAAEQSLPQAQFNLAIALMNGEGVERDPLEAVKWFTAAAELGDAESQYNLGLLYLSGDFVEKDLAASVRWFTGAAEQGYAKAQANLGVAYLKGRGVDPNVVLAAEWFEKAADKGHAQSQFNLGQAFEYGIGIPRDSARAAYWYEQSADQGVPTAQFRVGLAYRSGRGVEQDYVAAYKWLALAADAGYFKAREPMRELERRLATGDLAEARKGVQSWNQAHFGTGDD